MVACARNTSTTRTYRISCLSTSHIKTLGIYNGRTFVIASSCRAVCLAVVRKCLIHCQPAARSHSSDMVHQSLHTSQRITCVLSNVLSAIINRTVHIICPYSDIVSANSLPFFYPSRQIYLSVEGKCRTPASISYANYSNWHVYAIFVPANFTSSNFMLLILCYFHETVCQSGSPVLEH